MRTGKFEFYGKTYLLTFSARVSAALEADGIRLEELQHSATPVTTILKLLCYMIDAGDRYAKMNGIENAGVVTMDQLMDGMDLVDLQQKVPRILAEVVAGERHVEAEAPKNAGAPS